MEVILRENVEKLGQAGEIVKVRDGYARNYLLPKSLAYVASVGAKRKIESEQAARDHRHASDLAAAKKTGRILAKLTVNFTAKTGDGDRLFGSITNADIAEKLAELGHEIDKRTIEMDDPIKTLGDHLVPIRLHPEVRPEVTISVSRE